MKSYTDIEQSKKLAEILPIESADMHYVYDRHLDKLYGDIPYVIDYIDYKLLNKNVDIPCWSLGALLNVLPKVIDRDYVINITQNSTNTWFITYDLFADRDCSFRGLISKSDNLVDACYEMIIKLTELGIL